MLEVDLIIPNLCVSSKKQVFYNLAEGASRLIRMPPEALLDALLAREKIGITSIGGGVAIPHIRIENLQKTYGVLARLEKPIDYDATDGAPVDIVLFLMAPAGNRTTEHLKALAYAVRFLKDQDVCASLRAAADQIRLQDIIKNWVKTAA